MIRTPSQSHRHDRNKSGAFGQRRGQQANGLDKLLNCLRMLWCFVILYGELWAFTGQIDSCKWPTDFRYEVRQVVHAARLVTRSLELWNLQPYTEPRRCRLMVCNVPMLLQLTRTGSKPFKLLLIADPVSLLGASQ